MKRPGCWRDDSGSFTIEASLTAPLLVLCTLGLIALTLYTYLLLQLHVTAYSSSERAAYGWNQEAGGLYDDLSGAAAVWLGAAIGRDTTVELPVRREASPAAGLLGKLSRAVERLPQALKGSVVWDDSLWVQELRLQLKREFPLHALAGLAPIPSIAKARASAVVTNPVELVRLVELTRHYVPLIRERISPGRVRSLLSEPQAEDGGAVSIRSEREAAAYLRRATGGKLRTYTLPEGKSRVIDALDANGVAHQAFYTFSESQLLDDQLPKDEALRSDGTVKGIVWHFFRSSGAYELSPRLRRTLERKGVAIVVHQ